MAIHRRAFLLLVLLTLAASGIACQRQSENAQGVPSPPSGPIPVSQEAADRLQENFDREMQEASTGGEFRLFVTNEEITSLVALTLQDSGALPLSDPQIWFTGGRVYVTGTFSPSWPFSFKSSIVATAIVRDGQIEIGVEKAQMGPFPFPERVLQSASQSINETLAEMQLDLDVSALQILEGELQIAGTRRATEP